MYNTIDLTHLKWGNTRNNGASYGCYMKASEIINGTKWYYKLSNYNSAIGFYGDESVYEVISSRLLRHLGFNCLKYDLMKVKVNVHNVDYVTFGCKSKNYFTSRYDGRMTFENLREMYMDLTVEEVIDKFKLCESIRKMIIADFIIIGRDRHGGNIEILTKGKNKIMAPLFDNGLSFVCSITQNLSDFKERLKKFETLDDFRVNNYIGSQSLYDNLKYINKPIEVNRLTKKDKVKIFYNMKEVLPKEYIDKIWEIITYRYVFLRQKGFIVERS